MEVSIALIKELRTKTGAGMGDCKKALVESNGDIEKAIEYLRKKGALTATKRADKIANEGAVKSKISDDKKTGVIVEINCVDRFCSKRVRIFKNSLRTLHTLHWRFYRMI